VSESEEIVRIAAKGDGVTASGRHAAMAAPGDVLVADGSLIAGPHRAIPPCRHFGRCGGCQLQHLDDETLAAFVRDRVLNAASGQDLAAAMVAPVHLSPPCSRRRATLHASGGHGKPLVGFREAKSHRLVDLAECHVLQPELFALVGPLRRLLAVQPGRWAVDIDLTLADQGVDCSLRNFAMEGLAATEAALDFARDNRLARLSVDIGYGAEAIWEPEPVTITLGGIPVGLPPGAFLQATRDGEDALLAAAQAWLSDCTNVADLFAGLGTFAFGISGRVSAYEAARDAHLACRAAAARAGRAVEAHHRDLFRNPLTAAELDSFDAVILDPPRAGAREQVAQLAASRVSRAVYISCNPASWAKDARVLVDAGYRLQELRPVGQFRWSTHVELASLFVR
jgi:23S rRNA (uracil1939-C5)-methyltransferase